jgi:hypothetical protein
MGRTKSIPLANYSPASRDMHADRRAAGLSENHGESFAYDRLDHRARRAAAEPGISPHTRLHRHHLQLRRFDVEVRPTDQRRSGNRDSTFFFGAVARRMVRRDTGSWPDYESRGCRRHESETNFGEHNRLRPGVEFLSIDSNRPCTFVLRNELRPL